MHEYQQRLAKEQEELLLKTSRLTTFIESSSFEDLNKSEQAILKTQLSIMTGRLSALDIKIKNFI